MENLHSARRRFIVNGTGLRALVILGVLLLIVAPSPARPFSEDGFQGRIALSHDGNFNDEDDWGAFPVVGCKNSSEHKFFGQNRIHPN